MNRYLRVFKYIYIFLDNYKERKRKNDKSDQNRLYYVIYCG